MNDTAARAPRILSAAVLALAAPLASCGDGGKPSPAPRAGSAGGTRSSYLASLPIQSVEGKIAFGSVKPCGGDVTRIVRIRNQSDKAVEIIGYASNCACLGAKLRGSQTIGAGEEREVELVVHPAGIGDRSVAVEFGSHTGLAGSLRVDYSMKDGVNAVPGRFEIGDGAKDTVVDMDVSSGDGRPVAVVQVDPPIATIDPNGPPGAVRLNFSSFEARRFMKSDAGRLCPRALFDTDGAPMQLTVNVVTDHPVCATATVTIDFVH